jgi:hypothetical protein
MGLASLASASVDAYRDEADRFLAELDEEHYLHLAGRKDELDLAPIYERYADLMSLETCRRLEASVEDGLASRDLWRFACEGYFGELTREETEEVGRLEASLTVEVDGDSIPFRLTRAEIANEPDGARRERLERARAGVVDEHLNPYYVRSLERIRAAAPELGAPTYRDVYERFGLGLAALAPECEQLLDATEDEYVRSMDRLFRARVGIGLEDARRSDLLRLFRAADWDDGFPADAMLPALAGTLADLGIDLEAQENVELDLHPRPKKSPRAFCAPIEIPGRVVLVIQPIGGPDDWHALFHEAGHTEHYAHTSADLPMEARRLGDNAVTEGWAALFELLVDDRVWLTRRLSFGRPDRFAAETAATRLFYVRRYAAKLLYELELHGRDGSGELDELRRRYVEILGDATKIAPTDADFLADVDPGFYASSYIRSWAFEAQVQEFLREEFGNAWFTRREAGSLLRELWSEGQRLTADELVRELTGSALDLEAIVERTREPLRA